MTTNSMRQGVKETRNLMLWEKLKHYEVAGKIRSSRMENKGKSKTGKVLNMVAKQKSKITKQLEIFSQITKHRKKLHKRRTEKVLQINVQKGQQLCKNDPTMEPKWLQNTTKTG